MSQAQQAMLKSSGGGGAAAAGGADIATSDIDEPDIQKVVSQIVASESADLVPYLSLLNSVLLMSFPETQEVKDVRQSDR